MKLRSEILIEFICNGVICGNDIDNIILYFTFDDRQIIKNVFKIYIIIILDK